MADVAHLHFKCVGQYSRCVLCDMEYLTCWSARTLVLCGKETEYWKCFWR
jgi:hypothetical protein